MLFRSASTVDIVIAPANLVDVDLAASAAGVGVGAFAAGVGVGATCVASDATAEVE